MSILFSVESRMKRFLHFVPVLLLIGTFQGCTLLVQPTQKDEVRPQTSVTFSDPVLNQRRVLLFGNITQPMAEETIQKLFISMRKTTNPLTSIL